jgi:hypothetical protein
VRHIIEKEWQMVELGLFLPVTNNGWIFSTAAPQYQPSEVMAALAEALNRIQL